MSKQLDAEKKMLEAGRERYWRNYRKSQAAGMEANTPVGRRLLAESVTKLTRGIEEWKRQASKAPGIRHRALDYIEQLQPKVIAAITARSVIDSISHGKKLTRSAMTVARLLQDELLFTTLRKEEPDFWRLTQMNRQRAMKSGPQYHADFIKRAAKHSDIMFPKWPQRDSLAVGLVCVELMRQYTGIIEINQRRGFDGKTTTIVQATDEMLEWMKKSHSFSEVLNPVFMPTVDTPMDWTTVYSGGYHGVMWKPRPMVKTHDKRLLAELHGIQMPEVFEAINIVQRTGWSMNPFIYGTMKLAWEDGASMGDLPPAEDEPLPDKPEDIDTNKDSRREYCRMAASIHKDNESNQSKRLQLVKALQLCEEYDGKTMGFPHQFDFRGRMYPMPYFLQPQGTSWAKSLLMFKNGAEIKTEDDVSWLAIAGANRWGHDKKTFVERIEWVHSNTEWIEDCAKDPLGYTQWTKADEPWEFLAFCDEWARFKRQGFGFMSALPCSQDGTCNGIQILSLARLDPIGAYATNCMPCDRPQDIYGIVAEKVVEKVMQSTHEFAIGWQQLEINRSLVKRPVMTLPYGVTLFKVKQYLSDHLRVEVKKGMHNPFGDEIRRPTAWLGDIVWECIKETVSGAVEIMDWLKECVKISIENDTPLRWFTSDGFMVRQAYECLERYTVKTSIGQVIRQQRLRSETGELSMRRNMNGITANWTHSWDGCVNRSSIRTAHHNGVTEVGSVHDSLSTPAPHCGIMAASIREAAIEIFSDDPLERFRQGQQAMLPQGIDLPEPPQRGDLDINVLRDAPYFFS